MRPSKYTNKIEKNFDMLRNKFMDINCKVCIPHKVIAISYIVTA